MQKWEYCILEKWEGTRSGLIFVDKSGVKKMGGPEGKSHEDIVDILNQLGEYGWEVVGTMIDSTRSPLGITVRWVWTLRRPAAEVN